LLGSVIVLVHVPPHSVGVPDGQPDTHEYEPPPEAAHEGVPASMVHAAPHAPQLAALVYCTQAPLHWEYPVLQPNVQALLTQTPCALATFVVHPWPQLPQFAPSLVVSMQLPLQREGAAAGQPETHEYAPPAPAHTGIPPSALQLVPQPPQWADVEYCTQAPAQRLNPLLQAVEHAPSTHTASVFAMLVVHALPQVPQFAGVSRLTHAPSQSTVPAGHPASPGSSTSSGPAGESAITSDCSSGLDSPGPLPSEGGESGAVASSVPVNVSPVDASGTMLSTDAPEAHATVNAAALAIAHNLPSKGSSRFPRKAPPP